MESIEQHLQVGKSPVRADVKTCDSARGNESLQAKRDYAHCFRKYFTTVILGIHIFPKAGFSLLTSTLNRRYREEWIMP